MRIREYSLIARHQDVRFKAAVVADLHDHAYGRVLECLAKISPDFILAPGDITESLITPPAQGECREGILFLEEAVRIAPTFYSLGNHEIGARHKELSHRDRYSQGQGRIHPDWREAIRCTGAVLLDECFITWRGLTIGGLGSGLWREGRVPNLKWLENFTAQKGYKILMCHHPEYFDRYLRSRQIDLVVSGHAHGGQWRVLGRGIYAPDQYLFPKYTDGVHEERLVISRGVSNTAAPIPRFFNPCEVVMLQVKGYSGEKN